MIVIILLCYMLVLCYMLSLVATTGAALQMSLYANTMTIIAFLFLFYTSSTWHELILICVQSSNSVSVWRMVWKTPMKGVIYTAVFMGNISKGLWALQEGKSVQSVNIFECDLSRGQRHYKGGEKTVKAK